MPSFGCPPVAPRAAALTALTLQRRHDLCRAGKEFIRVIEQTQPEFRDKVRSLRA